MANDDFGTLFDSIKSKLETYSAAQGAALRFNVYADREWDFPADDDSTGADIFLSMADITPTGRTTNGRMEWEAEYHVDLVVRKKGLKTDSAYTEASVVAGARLRAMVLQVMDALFAADEMSLGLSPSDVSMKELQSIGFLSPTECTERGIKAARMTLKVGFAWEPTPISGVDLERITVIVDDWSTAIDP